jgi:hypothetical protein
MQHGCKYLNKYDKPKEYAGFEVISKNNKVGLCSDYYPVAT